MADALALPPGLPLLLGSLVLPLLPRALRGPWLVGLPLLGLAHALSLPTGLSVGLHLLGQDLVPLRVDETARFFGLLLHVAATLGAVYALSEDDEAQRAPAMAFAGAAIASVYAGDLASLVTCWGLAAVAGSLLVFAGRSERAAGAGLRYMLFHVGAAVLLLDGVLDHVALGGSLTFSREALLGVASGGHLTWGELGAGVKLMLVAMLIKAAAPLVHAWLGESLSTAPPTAALHLALLSPAMAVAALLRGFEGVSLLLPLGLLMAVAPLLLALAEDELRRSAASLLHHQLGMILALIGLGGGMALDGAAAMAATLTLAGGLLFMGLGALHAATGSTRASALGGLHHAMPQTAALTLLGGLALVGVPGLGAFSTTELGMAAAAESGRTFVWLTLRLAAVGAIGVAVLRLPFAAFYADRPPAHDLRIPEGEAPLPRRLAMGLALGGLLAVGLAPGPLYALLPLPDQARYLPYTSEHVLDSLQALSFATLAFVVMARRGLLERSRRQRILDVDELYRVWLPGVAARVVAVLGLVEGFARGQVALRLGRAIDRLYRINGPEGAVARTWPTGATAMWAAALLGLYLVVYYL